MHVGSKGWPVWSDSTDKLLLLKLLKKLMLVLIDRCHKEYTVHCSLLYGAALLQTNNGHVSIRNGPQSNGRRWPDMKNHVHFYIMWMAWCVCITYLGNTWHQDSLLDEGNPADAVWCFGQFSAGFCHVDITLTHTTYLSIVADYVHSFMETVFPDGCGLFHQKWIRNGLKSTATSFRCWLYLQIPQISIQLSICGMCLTNKSDPWGPHITTSRT